MKLRRAPKSKYKEAEELVHSLSDKDSSEAGLCMLGIKDESEISEGAKELEEKRLENKKNG